MENNIEFLALLMAALVNIAIVWRFFISIERRLSVIEINQESAIKPKIERLERELDKMINRCRSVATR